MTSEINRLEQVKQFVWPEKPDGVLRLSNMREDPVAAGLLVNGIAADYLSTWSFINAMKALGEAAPLGHTAGWAFIGVCGLVLFGLSLRKCEDLLRRVGADAYDDLEDGEEVMA